MQTPYLEMLAEDGMVFSAAYAPAPVCAPTRASLLTGMSCAALNWTMAGPAATERANYPMLGAEQDRTIASEIVTLPEMLRDAGYATAHFGKWHIGFGEGAPDVADYGFDEVKVLAQGNGPCYGIRPNHPRGTEYLVDDTIDFVSRHRDQPFFANVWLRDVHASAHEVGFFTVGDRVGEVKHLGPLA